MLPPLELLASYCRFHINNCCCQPVQIGRPIFVISVFVCQQCRYVMAICGRLSGLHFRLLDCNFQLGFESFQWIIRVDRIVTLLLDLFRSLDFYVKIFQGNDSKCPFFNNIPVFTLSMLTDILDSIFIQNIYKFWVHKVCILD